MVPCLHRPHRRYLAQCFSGIQLPPFFSLLWTNVDTMRVLVLSATTGELVWEHTSGSFWQLRGWELRRWLCEAIHCAHYFSVILLDRQLLLCDIAYIGEYADGEVLTVQCT